MPDLAARGPLLAAVVLLAAAGGAPLAAQIKRGFYENDALGFKVRVPAKWTEVPRTADEDWIVAKFLSDASYVTSGKDSSWEHKPLMKIIVFTDDAKKIKKPQIEKVTANTFFVRDGSIPYQSYQDYLKRNLQGQGFFFSKEEETEIDSIQCKQYEVQLHKSDYLKRRLVAWVFRGQGMDVAVEFELLEDRYDKLIKMVEGCLATFRFAEPAAPAETETAAAAPAGKKPTSELWIKSRAEWRKQPAVQRLEQRKEIERARLETVRQRTPADWTITETPGFLVVTHSDARYTKMCSDAAEAFRGWLDKTFGDLSDDYVRRGVLRVCKDWDEYEAYRYKGSRETSFIVADDREAVTYRDTYHGTSGRDLGFFLRDILATYVHDKDPLAYRYIPAWLVWGLGIYVGEVAIKGKQIEFKASDWEKQALRELVRERKLHDLKTLMTLDDDRYWKLYREENRLDYELAAVVRFVLGPGKQHPRLKTFLRDYLRAIVAVGEQFEDKVQVARNEAQTEAEEEKQAKSDQERLKQRRKDFAKALNDRTVNQWTEKDWESLQRAFEKSID